MIDPRLIKDLIAYAVSPQNSDLSDGEMLDYILEELKNLQTNE